MSVSRCFPQPLTHLPCELQVLQVHDEWEDQVQKLLCRWILQVMPSDECLLVSDSSEREAVEHFRRLSSPLLHLLVSSLSSLTRFACRFPDACLPFKEETDRPGVHRQVRRRPDSRSPDSSERSGDQV